HPAHDQLSARPGARPGLCSRPGPAGPARSSLDRVLWIRRYQQRPHLEENRVMTPTLTETARVAEVVDIIRKAAKIPSRVPITRDSRLVEDLAIDSLDLVGVILQLQDHFYLFNQEDAVPHISRVA